LKGNGRRAIARCATRLLEDVDSRRRITISTMRIVAVIYAHHVIRKARISVKLVSEVGVERSTPGLWEGP